PLRQRVKATGDRPPARGHRRRRPCWWSLHVGWPAITDRRPARRQVLCPCSPFAARARLSSNILGATHCVYLEAFIAARRGSYKGHPWPISVGAPPRRDGGRGPPAGRRIGDLFG